MAQNIDDYALDMSELSSNFPVQEQELTDRPQNP